MRQILSGQILLIICFIFYLIWWYRGYRPGMMVSRVQGINSLLLALTAGFGVSGIVVSVMGAGSAGGMLKVNPAHILIAGIAAFILLLLVTRYVFSREVTSELLLIVVWTMLEIWVIDALNGIGSLSDMHFGVLAVMLAAVFVVSIILYVAYYRMEEMKAFYTAMVPLVAADLFMMILIGMTVL